MLQIFFYQAQYWYTLASAMLQLQLQLQVRYSLQNTIQVSLIYDKKYADNRWAPPRAKRHAFDNLLHKHQAVEEKANFYYKH